MDVLGRSSDLPRSARMLNTMYMMYKDCTTGDLTKPEGAVHCGGGTYSMIREGILKSGARGVHMMHDILLDIVDR